MFQMSAIENPSTPSTSNSLLDRACEGESMAWQQIVQLYGPLVYSWARRTGLQSHDAADVTQETFAAVFAKLVRFDETRSGSTFRGWLWTITRNKAADWIRKRNGSATARGGSANVAILEQQAATASANDNSANEKLDSATDDESDCRDVIARAMACLRASIESQTWQAFWRTVVDGCSPDDVAEELGISRWAVYKARARVLQKLRTELRGLEDVV